MLVGAEIPRQKTALASEELKTIIATSAPHISSRFRIDGPRLELQISKFILLDALAPGNWLGAQSEEKNRVRMVALYKVEAEEKTDRCTVCPQADTDQDRAKNARCNRGLRDIVRTKRVALHRSHERLDKNRWKATPSMALFQRLFFSIL
jgi:hypothetical protein